MFQIKKIVMISMILGFSGCSSITDNPNMKQLLTKDDIYHTSLINTHKAQLIASLETKALLTATYLNPVVEQNPDWRSFQFNPHDGEYFFVGVYISDSKEHSFNTKGYKLTLNNQEPIEVKAIGKNDPLRYEMPMVDNWSNYYLVKFRANSEDEQKLIFESERFGEDVIVYSKAPKGLLDSLIN